MMVIGVSSRVLAFLGAVALLLSAGETARHLHRPAPLFTVDSIGVGVVPHTPFLSDPGA